MSPAPAIPAPADPATPPPPPKPVVYALSPRAQELHDALKPIREWKKKHAAANNPGPDLKPVAEAIDSLTRAAGGYLGEWLEPFPL